MFSFPFSAKGLTMINSVDGTRRGGSMPLNMRVKKPIRTAAENEFGQTTRFVFGHVCHHVIVRFRTHESEEISAKAGEKSARRRRRNNMNPVEAQKIVCAIRAPVLHLYAPMPRVSEQKKMKAEGGVVYPVWGRSGRCFHCRVSNSAQERLTWPR